ncbi:transcriptional regulator NrdR [Gloeobacter kilaueensis]|uniref:Transcriptional repressor NrdR n=1 Tax=Gloeobacter kilaueensis (strain ATCC BAA-2537 / CCAP 1431/1 / ULC 316 / JS1) TaxID=1183438 RepID=U5QGJ3_GLOK1|nr:transcriptional regulator NrdR [Gloeobacter kilaueensis]AGY58087.1 transcriptional regulator NrdR [Gloeobacter kilaueensis JS1]
MLCPFCSYSDNRVLESRLAEEGESVRRRRECKQCRRRFTTYERIEFVPTVVIKRNGRRENFDRSKVLRGVTIACEKTDVPPELIEQLVDDLQAELQQRSSREVTSAEIGEIVLSLLKPLNEVAYVRFASVYRKFKGVTDFVSELQKFEANAELDTLKARLERLAATPEQQGD